MPELEAIPRDVDTIGREVYRAALHLHSELGPGLLESVYKACLTEELGHRGFSVRPEVAVPLVYRDLKLDIGYRLDLLVQECVVVEVKSVESLHPVYEAQLLTYLRLSGYRRGYLMNFNVPRMKDGILRRVM